MNLAKPLTIITNQVLGTGIFPYKLKIAIKLYQYLKKETAQTKTMIDQYLVLPAISKIIEKLFTIKHITILIKIIYHMLINMVSENNTQLN